MKKEIIEGDDDLPLSSIIFRWLVIVILIFGTILTTIGWLGL